MENLYQLFVTQVRSSLAVLDHIYFGNDMLIVLSGWSNHFLVRLNTSLKYKVIILTPDKTIYFVKNTQTKTQDFNIFN